MGKNLKGDKKRFAKNCEKSNAQGKFYCHQKCKKEARGRGYKAHKEEVYGDAGYGKNIFAYINNDFSAKIMISRNAFQYRFIEYGANVRPRQKKTLVFIGEDGNFHQSKGFTFPANPLLTPIADSIWKTEKASVIMDEVYQQELNKFNRS